MSLVTKIKKHLEFVGIKCPYKKPKEVKNFICNHIRKHNLIFNAQNLPDTSLIVLYAQKYLNPQRDLWQQTKKAFYQSIEWRKVRYEVLREQKGKCQCCGRSAKDGVVLNVDHIIPLSKDWSKRLDKDNLQVLCEDCNLGKSNTDSIDWRRGFF